MDTEHFGLTDISSSRLVYGCMRIFGDGSSSDVQKGMRAIRTAVDAGYNHFDHADIYAGGEAETLFGKCLDQIATSGVDRDCLIITGKCGIRRAGDPSQGSPKRYDFSKSHIMSSVDGSLKRLNTDYLDILLLHRPDFLMDVRELSDTFNELRDSGKVRQFGVSNFSNAQIELLKKNISVSLVAHQLEINLHRIESLFDGRLDYCQQKNMVPMAWCPLALFAYEAWGNMLSKDRIDEIKNELNRQAEYYDCSPEVVIFAWLLKHPSGIFPIVGATNGQHIQAPVLALDLPYSRESWYRLLEVRQGSPLA